MAILSALSSASKIDGDDYLAAIQFAIDLAPSSGKSNTAAACERASRSQLDEAKEAKLRKEHLKRLDEATAPNDSAGRARNRLVAADVVGQMKGGDDSAPSVDPEGDTLRVVMAERRYARFLESWEINLLKDALIAEIRLDALALRWGLAVDLMERIVIETLMKLTKGQYLQSREFQQAVADYRRMTKEARA